MKRSALLLMVLIGFVGGPGPASGQDRTGDGFRLALPGKVFRFPGDHGAHREYRTEWWYYNGHLVDSGGRPLGYQLTFFRVGLRPPEAGPPRGSRWRIGEVVLAHLAVSDPDGQRFEFREKAARANLGLAGAATGRYQVWLETWRVEEKGGAHFLEAGDRTLGLSLRLTPDRPPIIHGLGGVSRKGPGPGRASHYYSLTRIPTRGEIRLNGKTRVVRGQSWMDHEFGSNQLGPDQLGWDWFALQIGDDLDLMLYQIRQRETGVDPHSSGTLVLHPGGPVHLTREDFSIRVLATWQSPRSGAVYPAAWELRVPGRELVLQVTPWLPDQELETPNSTRVTYWEGAVAVRGTFRGQAVSGKGYVELTGYDTRFRPRF